MNEELRTRSDAAMVAVRPFLSKAQMKCMNLASNGEEGAYFAQKFVQLQELIEATPSTCEQAGDGLQAVVRLHYFLGGSDWYISQKDEDGGVQRAYGYAVLNGDTEMAEWGYISIQELTDLGAELDLHFRPCTMLKIKAALAGIKDEGIL